MRPVHGASQHASPLPVLWHPSVRALLLCRAIWLRPVLGRDRYRGGAVVRGCHDVARMPTTLTPSHHAAVGYLMGGVLLYRPAHVLTSCACLSSGTCSCRSDAWCDESHHIMASHLPWPCDAGADAIGLLLRLLSPASDDIVVLGSLSPMLCPWDSSGGLFSHVHADMLPPSTGIPVCPPAS